MKSRSGHRYQGHVFLLRNPYQQSHFLRARALRVGLPFSSFIGPGTLDIRAQKDFLRGPPSGCGALSPGLSGFARLYDARPLAFRPPLGDCPAFRPQIGVLYVAIIVLHKDSAPIKKSRLGQVAFHAVNYVAHELDIPSHIPLSAVNAV